MSRSRPRRPIHGAAAISTASSEGSTFYEIKNSASGLLLGVSGEGTGDGADALI